MPNPAIGSLLSSSSNMIGGAVNSYFGYLASRQQQKGAQQGIDEIRQNYANMQQSFQPYTDTGRSALGAQADLMGLSGAEAEAAAIESIKNSPEFQSMLKTGETSILQNASATGGLRGGNTQGALATFSPQLLSSLIEKRYNNLGGLTQLGYGATTNLGQGGMFTADKIAQLLADKAAAKAGGTLAIGQGVSGLFSSTGKGVGSYIGAGGGLGGSGGNVGGKF